MTRSARPRPQAPPLAATLRQALAQGWHTLDALEALAGRATGARLRVHAALGELRAAGCVLEERVERGVAEVRLGAATGPAPVPDDGDGADLDATIVDLAREAQEMGLPVSDGLAEASDELGLSEEDTERLRPVWVAAFERRRAEREEAERALDAPDPLREPSPPVEDEPVDAASYYLGRGREEEDADLDAVRAARGRALREQVIASLPPGATPREIMFAEAAEIVRMRGPVEPATALDAPATPCEVSGPAEAADGPGEAPRAPTLAALSVLRCDRVSPPGEWERLRCERYGCDGAHEARDGEAERRWTDAPAPTEAERRAAGEEAEAAACARIAALPKGRGPGSRCANCDATRAKHEAGKGCGAWAEKPRGRPRVAPAAPSPTLDAPQPTTDARAVYEAIKAAGNVRVVASGEANASEAVLYAAAPDAAEEARRLVPPPQCPSVWHDIRCDREAGHPCGSADEPGRHHSAHEGRSGWTDEAAAGWAQRRAEERETARGGSRARRAAAAASPVVAPPCRPPACHADDIHVPSAVRDFARPLCERHRAWVEGAGGTVAAGGLAGVLPS